MARRLMQGEYEIVEFNRTAQLTRDLEQSDGVNPFFSLSELVQSLKPPWINHSDVPAPAITLALFRQFESRQDDSYATKLLATMRNQFGGHAIKKIEGKG